MDAMGIKKTVSVLGLGRHAPALSAESDAPLPQAANG